MLLVEELEKALDAGLYAMALNTALIIPEICGALESPDGIATAARYKKWFDVYVTKAYTDYISSDEVYGLRCVALHHELHNDDKPSYDRIMFEIPGEERVLHRFTFTAFIPGGDSVSALNLNVVRFCKDMITAYELWRYVNGNDPIIENNEKKGIKHYPDGLLPYSKKGSFLG